MLGCNTPIPACLGIALEYFQDGKGRRGGGCSEHISHARPPLPAFKRGALLHIGGVNELGKCRTVKCVVLIVSNMYTCEH